MKLLLGYRLGVWMAIGLGLAGDALIPGPVYGGTTLVPAGAVWKYLDNGSDQGTAWSAPAFDDSGWAAGAAQLGYGDGDEVTVVGFGSDPNGKAVTTYFRRTIVVTNTAEITNLNVRLLRDDGGVVYLNGVEVFRSNMPVGPITFDTLAISAAGGADESTMFYEAQIAPNLLSPGPNVVAVEIHQNAITSSDLSFDLELLADGSSPTNPPPVPPTIVTQPQSLTLSVGETAIFSVEATGTAPLFYRWRRNGVGLPGATGPSLTLFNVQPTNAGNYSVIVSNLAGSRISSNAVLQVLADTNQPMTVTLTSPTNGAIFVAPATILLRATTTGPTGSVAYVEFFEGTNRIAQDFIAPYIGTWSNVPPGNFQLRAAATFADGTVALSSPVNITVTGDNSVPLTLIPTGAVWNYFADGIDLGTAWREMGYDDSAWASGPAQLGYGDGDEVTVVGFGPDPANKYITTYFRRAFGVTNLGNIASLTVRLLRDDGGIVYLNGVEVFRSNMPGGPINFNSLAVVATEDSTFYESQVPPNLLVAGPNIVAVEIHQNSPASSDMSFDLALVANGSSSTNPPPVAPTIITQPQSQTVLAGQNVTFSVEATGTAPLFYQWRRNGLGLPGATGPSLTIFNVQSTNAGSYSVIVSNLAGSRISSNAVLQVLTNTNQPLTVTLTSPTNGATFAAPAFIVLNATASGPVGRVEFYSGTNRIGQDFTAPYSVLWSNVPPGNYQLTAVAVGSNGTAVASAPANITVTGGGDPAALTLIPAGAVWKYLDNGTDQGSAWAGLGFDDSTWASGPAQLGYGDGDEATVVSFGPDPFAKYITTYFRRTFGVTNIGNINSLTVRLLRDDGGVVYLNGVEVFRSNMPDGPIAFNTLAPLAVDESTFYEAAISPALLVAGPNLVAVEIHQSNPASSDISFDLALVANAGSTTNPPPVPPTIVNQPQSQTVLAGATVTFSVGATGTLPLEYAWRFNGVPIPGGTAPVLTLVNVGPTNAGNYSVIVSNPAGFAISSNAVLQVLTNTNPPPTVTLTSPTNGSVFTAPATIVLTATASPGFAFLEFFAGTNRIGQDFAAPFSTVWSNVPPGSYQLRAVGTAADGTTMASAPVNITVTGGSNAGNLTLISTGAVWKYLDNGLDQGTAWTGLAFDDSTWASGPAQLGFGDGDEATVVGFGPDPTLKNITTYFRRTFGVTNTASITSLTVRLLRDDGGVVYLNGVEIFRSNMPQDPVTFDTLALTAAGGPDESTMFYEGQVPPNLLVPGANVVAVEIHQNSPLSSDLSFDLQLVAQRSTGVIGVRPTIVTQPQSQTVVAGSTVSFNVVATGTPPLIYRWRREGINVGVTTNGTFTIFNVQPAQAGNYSVIVTNIAGSAISSNALLTVISPPTNHPPVAMASVSPRSMLFPDQGGVLIISPNNSNALVVLDGSLSSDPDNDPLEYVWFAEGGSYAVGVQVTNILELGNYTFILEVDDGELTSMDSVTFEVITAGEAVDFIIERINDSPFGGSVRRPLIATLRSAQADFDAGEFMMGVRKLHAFQMKVQTRVTPADPALASLLVNAAQAVIDAVNSP